MSDSNPCQVDGADLRGARVLIVDDDAAIRRLLDWALVRAGYECVAIGDGHAALELMGRESFDLVICDINLPGPSGLELLASAGSSGPGFILITGEPTVGSAVRGLRLDAVDYLQNPSRLGKCSMPSPTASRWCVSGDCWSSCAESLDNFARPRL